MKTKHTPGIFSIKKEIKKLADYAFQNGYSTTHFMRHIAYNAPIDIYSPDDFYHKVDNPYMEKILNWVGYEHSLFGIMRKATE